MSPRCQHDQCHEQGSGNHNTNVHHASSLECHNDTSQEGSSYPCSKEEAKNTARAIDNRRSTLAAIVALVITGAIALFGISGCASYSTQSSKNESNSDNNDPSITEETARAIVQDFWTALTGLATTSNSLDKIPADEGIQTFSLNNLSKPELSAEEHDNIDNALRAINQQAAVGIVFYNTNTRRGISYNPDAVIYGASSFKALYALYVCEKHIEPGELEPLYLENTAEGYYPYEEFVQMLIEDAVVDSDNDSFGTLREMFDFTGFDEWATSLGATDTLRRDDSWFPWYSARSSAKLWSEMHTYFQSNTPTAQWLSSLCEQTNVSFIRNSLEPLGATVRDKAGWCASSDWDEYDYNSLCDAGIVELDGNTYIISVMTSLPDSEENYELIEALISSLFEAHNELD